MKTPYWTDPNDSLTILEASDEALTEYGLRCGSDFIKLRPEHITALEEGKVLAWNDGEYTTFVILITPSLMERLKARELKRLEEEESPEEGSP